uniref:Uncharacterized protein n=1 Tax=Cannabis sativa TaxID=3483 RepID=A0A803Q5Q5_CANSA
MRGVFCHKSEEGRLPNCLLGSRLRSGYPVMITVGSLPSISLMSARFLVRLDYGTIGKSLLVKVSNRDSYHFDESLTPKATSKKVTQDIIIQLGNLYRSNARLAGSPSLCLDNYQVPWSPPE